MSDRIPYWLTKLGDAESAMIAESIGAGRLSMGVVTQRLEQALAEYLGVSHVVATLNGSTALYLAASGLGIGAGDEVILPNRTFVATAHAVMLAGAKVKLVDVRSDKTVIDQTLIERAITPRTKAILPVHLNGNHADMVAIRAIAKRHGLHVFEDAAQAFGSRNAEGFLGTLSDAGCFSLGVTKMITTGQGGFVATNDDALAERMRRFRGHGVYDTYEANYERFGFNLRFTDIAASVGLVQLEKMPVKLAAHERFHRMYREGLADLDTIRVLDIDRAAGNVPLWAEAVVGDRDAVIAKLEERNIQTRPFLPNLSVSPYLGDFRDDDFPHSQYAAEYGFFLPSGPDLPVASVERVIEALRDVLAGAKPLPAAPILAAPAYP